MSRMNMDGPTTKSVQCSICNKRFSRTDHLKRHQLRHSGVKPYSCIFCGDAFTRSDNLRDHYPSCPQRRNRQIPEAARGGRRSHACDSCTFMKLGCDGNNPCKTCRHKKIDCKFARLESKGLLGKSEHLTKSSTDAERDASSDRGSIKFLLNSGTASFIECFRLPSSHERRNLFNFRNTQRSPDSLTILDGFANSSENGSTASAFSDPFEDEPIDWSLFEDENLLRFLSSPFNEVQMQSEDLFAPLGIDQSFAAGPNMQGVPLPEEWESPSEASSAAIQAISQKTMTLQLSPPEQADISHHLNYLFTPSRMRRLISLYFEFWHPHCPITHQGTFNMETAPTPLLVAVLFVGAMYSQVDRDVSSAKLLLDLAELYVFSIDDLTDEFEIRRMLRAPNNTAPDSLPLSNQAFQHLQAAYLVVCVQFWAGNMVSRKRAIDTKFGVVLKVARRIGLTKARHELDDSVDEDLWIKKESQIRLMNIITLLDCAFAFFANFPCRLMVSEMRFDLPCEESIFSSPHPFAEPKFAPSRHLTTFDAFQSLFGQLKSTSVPNQGRKGNPLGLNPMDMFILVHILYVYAHTHVILFSPSLPRTSDGSGGSTPTGAPCSTSDTNLALIRAALSRWRSLWTTIRSNIPSQAWASLGFFRNGYNYWLVTQLLINNKGSVDVMMGMEVGCEDTLKQLKGLLKESGNDP
ncbi:putative C2H2 finger domain protein [Hyaloscypha bicolor E]|uniref:Putative C2H2 finger domain protein n=1 Tax=Hyaloscypha bicolor E TaxID=1095630 RepID=A0A2J6STQ7_9HELO|nr:putative C2H2 finger domain protein [Hyaloscypha bicolor E]PMD54151.1 putative C2H2 finger domain protein [Hyaloscypha bicolor E]